MTAEPLTLLRISRLIGAGVQTVRDWVLSGRLPATQEEDGRRGWMVGRDDLVSWLLRGGWTPAQVRCALLPIDGEVILVGSPGGHGWPETGPVFESTLFGLGLSIARTTAKAAVIDFHNRLVSHHARLRAYAQVTDRPILVGLVTAYNVTAVSKVCDLVFDREIPAKRVMDAVNNLLRWSGR